MLRTYDGGTRSCEIHIAIKDRYGHFVAFLTNALKRVAIAETFKGLRSTFVRRKSAPLKYRIVDVKSVHGDNSRVLSRG